MKSILISTKSKMVAKILNGYKSAEIRRTAPKEWVDYLSGKTKEKPKPKTGYIYCTKRGAIIAKGSLFGELKPLNGKIVAKFTLREVEKINCETYSSNDSYQFTHEYFPEKSTEDEILRKSCISGLEPYLDGCEGYAWYISDLVIFDKPKELIEFGLKRAPQSWCYVEAEE